MTLFVMVAMAAGAQKYTVRKSASGGLAKSTYAAYPDSIRMAAHVSNAGGYLRRSAGCEMLAWGTAIVSGVAYSGILSDDRKTANLFGTLFAVAAVTSKVLSIHYKSKAGTELTLAPGSVVVRF